MPSRWPLLLGAVLLIPAAMVAVYGVLTFGGAIEEQERAEIRLGEEALAELKRELLTQLRGEPVRPLPELTELPAEGLSSAERIGLEYEAQGDHAQALRYLDQARPQPPLRARMAKARSLLATGRKDLARELLAVEVPSGVTLDGVPVRLSLAMLRARAGDAGAVWREVLAGAVPVPAALADQVVHTLKAYENAPPAAEVEDYLWRARAAQILALGLIRDAGAIVAFPDGGVWLRTRNELLSPRAVAKQHARLAESVGARFGVSLRGSSGASVAADTVVGIATTARLPVRGSEGLRLVARWCLVLAVVSFLLGNLGLWFVVRRTAALSRLKTDFIDVVSHELRTPLTALSVKAEMLACGDVPPAKLSAYQRSLHEEVNRLSVLVHDVLDFGRLERGAYRLTTREVTVRDLVAQAVRASRDALRLGRQRLAIDVPRQLPDLRVDVEVCVRALRNLIDNATRHAPAQSAIELSVVAGDARLRFEIQDRGPGFQGVDPAELFQPFRRGAARRRGTGLGLAIVDRAVRAHGGQVQATERSGGGARFVVELPLSVGAGGAI